jgi:hypothetical protein
VRVLRELDAVKRLDQFCQKASAQVVDAAIRHAVTAATALLGLCRRNGLEEDRLVLTLSVETRGSDRRGEDHVETGLAGFPAQRDVTVAHEVQRTHRYARVVVASHRLLDQFVQFIDPEQTEQVDTPHGVVCCKAACGAKFYTHELNLPMLGVIPSFTCPMGMDV